MNRVTIAIASLIFVMLGIGNSAFADERLRAMKQFEKQQNKVLFSKDKDHCPRGPRGFQGPDGTPGEMGNAGTNGTNGNPGPGITTYISSVVNGEGQALGTPSFTPVKFNTDIASANIINGLGTFQAAPGYYEVVFGIYPDYSNFLPGTLIELALEINGIVSSNTQMTTQSTHQGTAGGQNVTSANTGWLTGAFIVHLPLPVSNSIALVNFSSFTLPFDTSGSATDTKAFITIKQVQ
jgi:hypothetical protein